MGELQFWVIDVSKELIQVYEDYLIDEYPDIEPDYVFVNIWGGKRGEPLNYRLINQILKQLEKKTGVYVYPHLFRHTHATELIDEHLHLLPAPVQRMVILIRTLGLRSCELLGLKFDCLRQHKNQSWSIEFVNWKFNERLDRLPINMLFRCT